MNCIDAHIELAPGASVEVSPAFGPGLRADLELAKSDVALDVIPSAFRSVSFRRVGKGIRARLEPARSGMRVVLEPICKTNISGPYLEIAPKILWIADWGANDVYSNTDWIVQ